MIPWGMFPFNDEMKKLTEQMNPSDIQKYVNNMINKHFSSQWNHPANKESTHDQVQQEQVDHKVKKSLQADVFETFDHIYIRIHLPDQEAHKRMKIFYTSNQAIIENFPRKGDRHTITLPRLVKKKGATARVKDQILELKIPINIDMQYSEIEISENF